LNSRTAVVILNYNGEGFLRQFLPSVIQHSLGAEIIVADNASTDSSVKVMEHDFPQIHLIKLENNYGFCGGYNRALKQIETDYFVLLNSDVEVTHGWLKPLQNLLDSNPIIAAVQPKIKSFYYKNDFEYAGAAGGFIDLLGYPFCRGRLFEDVEEDKGQYNDSREIFWATGACMMVRADLFTKVGGLDEDFFAHMEEIDLCWRLKRSGYSIYFSGDSTVYHVGGGTLSKEKPTKTFLNFRNGLYVIFKNLPVRELVWKLPVRIALDYLAALKFLVDGRYRHASAIFRAHYHFVKNLSQLVTKRKQWGVRTNVRNLSGIFKTSIIWEHFIKRKKKIDF